MMARKREGLSERHIRIMDFLTRFQDDNGYPPTIREIGDSIGVKSTSLVDYYLDQLRDVGFIERDKRISRSIRVLKRFEKGVAQPAAGLRRAGVALNELISIPVVGRIFASQPVPLPEVDGSYYDSESTVEIARSLLPSREKTDQLFALEVQGDSMIDAMINEGDIVIMKRAQDAANGEMVAVWLDDKKETTLKYFYRENGKIRLQPANPTMKPIYVENPSQLQIQGKVVMVVRQLWQA
jgi:repressor LexA